MNKIKYLPGHLRKEEDGQTAVLFAVAIVGLILLVALAIDGGSVLNGRRVTQNAADSGALTGIHYLMSGVNSYDDEAVFMIEVNKIIEANGVLDTDGIPGNEINDNITIYYTDNRGNLLTGDCTIAGQAACGGKVPPPTRGLNVDVDNQVSTFFLGIISRDVLDVGASAVAVARGGSANSGVEDNVLVAFGECTGEGDKPLDISTNNTDFIGGLHAATYFWNRGDDNHYHGQVTYGLNYFDPAAVPPVYEPNPPGLPQQMTPYSDPFAGLGLTVDRFECGVGDIGSTVPAAECYNLEAAALANGGFIDNQWLKNNHPGDGTPYLIQTGPKSHVLRDGLYYLGAGSFDAGWTGMVGTVTIVSENNIKITGEHVQLTGYMPSESLLPGLLFYSSLRPPEERVCDEFGELVDDDLVAINTTGSSGSSNNRPGVYHSTDREGCVNLDNPTDCYELGALQYIGLIYASDGMVATSGNAATYVGAIVAYTIRVNGSMNRSNQNPEKVGALFVYDSTLFPPTDRRIFLDR